MKKLLLLLAFVAMYISVTELNAKRKAEEACSFAAIGDPIDGLLEKGLAVGARSKDSGWSYPQGDSRRLQLAFTGFAPGSDFFCMITERNGSVSKKAIHLSSLLPRREH